MSAFFIINQPDGAGSGVTGVARNDLWLDREIQLSWISVGEEGEPVSYQWDILDKPYLSEVPDDLGTSMTASFTPDVWGSYRIRLITNGGASQSILIAGITKTYLGGPLKRGWRLFAFKEQPEEANWPDGNGETNLRGYSTEWGIILADIADALDSGGGGGGGAVTFDAECDAGLSVGAFVYVSSLVGSTPVVAESSYDDLATIPVKGMVVSKSSSTVCTVQISGLASLSGLTANARYWLGTGGGYSATPPVPSTGDVYAQQLGYAVTTTQFALQLDTPVTVLTVG